MLTPLIVLLFLVLVLSLIGRMARASRRRSFEEEQRRHEELQRSDGDSVDSISPFGLFPFGGILEEMMRGMETRSYELDPETGEWVEITSVPPAQPEREPEPAAEPQRKKRKSRTRSPGHLLDEPLRDARRDGNAERWER